MSLDQFVKQTNDLLDFEILHAQGSAPDTVHAIESLRVELNSLWDEAKNTYLECRDHKPEEGETPIDKAKLRSFFKEGLSAYKACLGSLNDQILTLSEREEKLRLEKEKLNLEEEKSKSECELTLNTRVPPLDTETFHGDYNTWPSFRDLFSAIYIRNSKISNVEKLFYLTQKTSGEAREIISNIPLTNDGFDIAWRNLVDRYENKRMQVNEQIKTLLNLPQVAKDNGTSLKKLQRTVNTCIDILNTLQIKTGEWDPLLVYLSSMKLPRNFLEEFEDSLDDRTRIPTWGEFNTFLNNKFKTLEQVGNIQAIQPKNFQPRSDKNFSKDKRVNSFQINTTQQKSGMNQKQNSKSHLGTRNKNEQSCQLCKSNHFLRECPKFIEKSINDRIHLVKTSNLCYNCLSSNHGVRDCKSRYNCRECSQRHNTLLHKGNATQPTESNPTRDDARPSISAASLNTYIQFTPSCNPACVNRLTLHESNLPCLNQQNRETLLFTAIVQIESRGQRYDARAIIDSGSQSSFISDKLKNRLKLPTKQNLVHVTGLNQSVSETSTQACIFTISSRMDPSFKLEVWAPVLKTLPSSLPPKTFNKALINTVDLELADPHLYTSRPVDLLIGLDLGPLIYDMEAPMRSFGTLLAQKTVFGWVLGGPVTEVYNKETRVSLCNTVSLEKAITRFWEVEETPKKVLRSKDDIFCEEIFRNTTRRNESGRYIVKLPFKPCEELGSSRNIALAQFHRMEKKLERTPEVKNQYDQVLREYLELGHMRKISPTDVSKTPNYYLPHHAVIKPDRVTTKMRIVFNASSPSSNKKSLNDILYPGPILQQDLVLQILKWRFFKFVFNADVTKMYRQILLDPSQTNYQRILYRFSPNDPVEDYELLTVTFGLNCAPFLALRVLQQLEEDVKKKYPLAANIINQNLYVDDVLAGGHNLDEALKSRNELISAFASAGFELMKWTSNDPLVLQHLPPDSLLHADLLSLSEGVSTKTLGIRWNISLDSFTFTAPEINARSTYTKREVLSTIAKFFDPCGWLAPVIVVAKLIMQQLWLDKINWDDSLKFLTEKTWQNFVKNCPSIDTITIPRWIKYDPSSLVEIHGFCDASEKAYAATLYVRVCNSDNSVYTYLLAAKTRVAPIAKKSLPRLELCGAVLLSDLAASELPKLQVENISTQFWTDSTIVLAWLKKPPCTWSTFVGNRVSHILENVGIDCWKHVDSAQNPADIGSRGCTPTELKDSNLWWHGPTWLKLPKNQWPSSKIAEDTTLEAKPIKVFTTTTFEDPLARFSSFSRALKVLAQVLRWRKICVGKRNNLSYPTGPITAEELKDVRTRLIVLTQKHNYFDEYQSLSQKRQISHSSSLLTLNPFLDPQGIIRANGRLVQSTSLSYNERHPVILPYGSKLSELIVEFTHLFTIHGGNRLVIRALRMGFWIFRVKVLVKKVINNCKTCILYKRQTQSQIMSSLPPERTFLSRPFTNTGVDFAGPFSIKREAGRTCSYSKGYVCVFVCFATKAVHLEATSDLSTEAFLAALARFIGRRGCPTCIFSDNGTNFTGAQKMLKKDRLAFIKTLQTNMTHRYSHQELQWKFIPPGAPHMGGLWEAGVKSFKTHLRKHMPVMSFTFEELSTILVRIEACLNSRPLSPASDDPNDLNPLTPGHFLIGTPLLAPPEPELPDDNLQLVNRWKRLKIVSQHFCQRWKSEYLAELHRRYKWKYQQENVNVNDLVVIKDERLPPNEWKLGRITKTYLGPDQNTRVVEIKTSNGIISRPITKIVKLFSA